MFKIVAKNLYIHTYPETNMVSLDTQKLRNIGGYYTYKTISKPLLKSLGLDIEIPRYEGIAPFIGIVDRSQELIQIAEHSDLYSSREFIAALTRASDRKVQIEIIHGPIEGNQSDELTDLLARDNTHSYMFGGQLRNHYIIGDGKHAGLEMPIGSIHLPGELPLTTLTLYNSKRLTNELSREFAETKKYIANI